MTPEELARKADTAGLRLVRFLWCGSDGTVRAKASGRHGLEARLARGIDVPAAVQVSNSLDQVQSVEGFEGELRLLPDLDTFRSVPYAPKTGVVLTDGAQRRFLKRMEERLGERGLTLRAAFENEFSLAREKDGDYTPVDSGLSFSTISAAKAQRYVDALVAALEAQRIPPAEYAAGRGPGQHAIRTRQAPAVQAADEQVLVRETIRGVAAAEGELVATLAPRPWAGTAGNRARVHFSLWEADRQADAADAFLAGVREHLRGLCGLAAASVHSYALQAQVRAGAVLEGGDASANPYLALGGVIAAGLDGLDRGLALGDPAPVELASLPEALDALAGDAVLGDALGDELTRSYLAVRRSELTAFAGEDEEFALRHHFEKY